MPILEDVLGSRTNITILRYLTAIRGALSGNEIATRLGLRQSTARQALERLVATGVITRADIGNSAAYELDHELAMHRSVLVPLFRAEAGLHDELLETVVQICGRLKPPPNAVFLFGSLARGERDFRDIDLLCVTKAREKSALHDAVAEEFEAVRPFFKVPVSAIVVTEEELRSRKFAPLKKEILRDGLLLFGMRPSVLRDVRAWKASD
jgi:predicted nucleotidyltransferase